MPVIKVAVWGFGNMGRGIVEAILKKKAFELTAVIVNHQKSLVGKKVTDQIGSGLSDAVIFDNLNQAVAHVKPDVIIHATGSFMVQVEQELASILTQGINVVTIAEQAAFPWANAPEVADRLDRLAKEHQVSLVGTGINPGFVLDNLVIMLTGACLDVDYIEASRINDLSPFGQTVMKTQGVGTTVEEFRQGIANGTIVGHIGFEESIHMIATALGWKVDKIVQTREPIVTQVYRETPCVKVPAGGVAGCRHIAEGYVDGKVKIKLIHPQQIHPEQADIKTGDYITIDGRPSINIANTPEIPGGIGTMATAVNVVPLIVNAKPGFLTMADLPVVRAVF
ncbi:MAG: NADP-binding protein [Candidatus Delongbacteria bacterium]|nr:NADP-binding protein [Candidatus Delongbacteria bacterium]